MQRRNSLAESKRAYFYGTGRRKTAVARVRLYPGGDGTITVNGR
ncbi:MAG TPA: 30S ribosomal protein S9, partial [Ktedonobacterales bacterium]|nr:30S ribosomal protein S9 [Ktedonobacterales bacterium]